MRWAICTTSATTERQVVERMNDDALGRAVGDAGLVCGAAWT
jgi:hypothetical protein